MNRTDVIQKIADKTKAQSYLEIGVAYGNNFFPLRIPRKIAVDPAFKFTFIKKMIWGSKNHCNFGAKYYRMTSDAFFSNIGTSYNFDLIFLDGLHTYGQTLKDVHNSLGVLKKDGVIVMHDCNPPFKAAAHPANSQQEAASMNLPGWTGAWNGDVWKTIVHLRSERKDLKIFVLNCDFGLGIITRGNPDSILSLSIPDIEKMTYDDLERDRENLLNLKPENYFEPFLSA